MKNKGAKQKLKRKGATGAFGCDLTEYLETSGQDVPYVLRSCAEFIETHGIVDGIYRLSGVTSNIQKLRQEFGSDQCPDLTREVYLQDIHCVGSLCKLYFRELPNPLLTYELYEKFTQAVSHCPEEEDQLARIQNVIQELPPPHYRTLEYLIRHLTHIASFSNKTNMHTRNLALVWAPNLLRSKEIEAIGCNGDAAFLAVRVQQVVIEFILNHVDQIFSSSSCSIENDENRPIMKSLTLPALSLPMKLVSLEEAQARSLATNHPARKERRENSLPEIVPSTGALFHTVLELPDNKRKLSSKSKKWKSIFNLGRSGSDSKSKLNRNGSVFVRGQRLSEKATIRPAKSMDSLCSLPVEGKEAKGHFNRTVTTGGFFIPAMKLQTTSTGSSCDLSKQEGEWGQDGGPAGAEGGSVMGGKAPQARPPPEQLKVFRAVEDPENDQASPKMLAMFYTSNDSSSKSVFTSSLFQMESSPRHQRKALNISEPFAVSVPLRVSAVISTNSTPCRTPPKEMQSLSSLEESSFQGAEGGGWPGFEEEKTPVADASAASASQKLRTIKSESLEDSKPIPEKERAVECSCNHSPEPSTYPREKEICTISASLPFSTTLEKRQDSEEATKISESLQSELSAQQESSSDKKEDAMFLSEMDEDDSSSALMWPEIQQELKIIESEEELQALPSTAPMISTSQPILISSPKTTLSPWTRGFSDDSSLSVVPMEETTDKTSQAPPPEGAVIPMTRVQGDPQQLHSHQRTEQATKLLSEQSRQGDSASPQDSLLTGSSGNLFSPPPPLEQTLQKEDSVTNSPEREETSEAMGANPHSQQTRAVDSPGDPGSFYQREEVISEQGEKQSPKEKTEKLASGGEGQLREFGTLPHRERDRASLMQDTFDYDEEDTSTDIAPQSLEMVEPWEDHQWVTSPLHSPTLKDIQENHPQELLLLNPRKKRLPHRPSFVQSHSLDSETTMRNQWTHPFPSLSSCVSLGSLMAFDPLQLLPPNREKGEWEKKAPRHSKELSEPEGTEDVLGTNSGGDIQSKTVRTSPVCFTEKETKVDQESLQPDPSMPVNQQGSCGSGSENARENSPSRVQDKASPGMPLVTKGELLPSPKLQLKNNDCVPPKGKNRPSSLNLDCVPLLNDFFRFENVISLSSPGSQLYDQGEAKKKDPNYPWSPLCMTSPQSKADPWRVHCGPQDLDMVTHALTGRRNSAPVSVSAVRTSFMVKMCQARAVPVIPPKIQYTQIPQPLQAQNIGDDVLPPVEKAKAEASPTGETPPKSAGDDSPPSLGRPRKNTNPERKENDSIQMDSTSFVSDDHTLSPDPCVSCLLSSQDASVPCRKRTSETEPSGDNPLSSKIERSSGVSKPFHRSRPGRPQSLILFSPPFPIMDHPSSSSDSRVLLSPIRSPTQTISSGVICGELAENTWVTPEGVTLRNKMTIPKNGQRLETSTSCFYQPQRRSVILDGRSGRQIE
ncbi:rho GTPase-activating protein 31 isoform X2 [Phascolarctos cinereus]|uniref:Rho GTPase-activating protein 31 isoform X2 n=1 Tax=Phascolarctos cinereus TaxID=38626 RepID=A0A6P5K830_PHACI|nr:rho GTPase-activating protein 31 isoform X2 [Phascolarctos cinereus]